MRVRATPNVTIRTAADDDRPAILAAIADLQDYERTIHDTRRPGHEIAKTYLAWLMASVTANAGLLLIAEAGGEFAGFAACWVRQEDALAETEESNRYGYISDTFVMPALRGRGIAGHLIRAAEVHLRATGVTRLRIGVLAANRSAQRAYSKSGVEPYELTLEKRLTIKGGPDFRN
jgi:ribosomal protein S18 acetylase RimI-like enzyme